MGKHWLIAGSILIGSTIIAIGLHAGLRDRRPAAPGSPAGPPPPTRPADGEERAGPVLPPPAKPGDPRPAGADGETARTAARRAATRELEARRRDLVATCWTPFARKAPEPKRARFKFNLIFDAEGREAARGIAEVRGEERPEAARCLRSRPLDLRIPAPGQPVSLEVDLVLP
jgi:hypothetical protein